MLKELPETLDETYERILRDINKANWDHAHRLLQCLTVAVRPLRVAELAEVLAVDFGTASRGETSTLNTDWRWEDQQEAVLSTCSSLISIVDEEGSQIVQFSHFSVKEFLTSSRIAGSSVDVSAFHILLEPAHTVLAEACLVVLLRLGGLVDKDSVEDKYPLARYAAEHWVDHAQFENVSSHIREGMEHLFDPDKPHFAAWLQVHDIDIEPLGDSFLFWFAIDFKSSSSANPLYYAALCGFHDLAEHLIIKHPEQVHTTGGYFVSPLVAALSGGHLKIAQVLHERGADVDVRGYNNSTSLNRASGSGHFEIVQWLLSHRANPNAGRVDDWTSLHEAANSGHVEVSRLLLQYKADIHAHNGLGKTPLHLAVQSGHANVARLLLEHGADVNARESSRNTSLHLALKSRCPDVARLLVEHGANIDAKDGRGRTAFQVALEYGYHDFAKWLSYHGAK
jgi:ankyrin repeat protein